MVETVGGHEPGGGLNVGFGIKGGGVGVAGGGTGPGPGGVGELVEAEVAGVTKGGGIPAALAPGDAEQTVGGKAPAGGGGDDDVRDVGLSGRDLMGAYQRRGAGGDQERDGERAPEGGTEER